MIYEFKITYKLFDDSIKELSIPLDTDVFNITYADMATETRAFAEQNRLSFGTMDGTIRLTEFWGELQSLPFEDIKSLSLIDPKTGITIYNFNQPVANIIYNINFNTVGDILVFVYEKGKTE